MKPILACLIFILAGCARTNQTSYLVQSYDAAADSFTFTQGNLQIRARCDEAGGCRHLSGIVGSTVMLDRGSDHVFLRNGKKVGEMFVIESITRL